MIKLASSQQCTGCTACYASCATRAISMISDEHGCKHPIVDKKKCVKCHRCEKICPVLNVWRPYDDKQVICLAAKAKDEAIRLESSSGGVFYILGRYVIEQGGCVFGCVWQKPDILAVHEKTETLDKLAEMRRSKYVQSNLGDVLQECKQELEKGKLVLFSGTPCQIAGLNHYLGKKYDNLITVEVICHGVPMPSVFDAYKRQLQIHFHKKLVDLTFKVKDKSWRDSSFYAIFEGNEEQVPLGTINMNPYGKAFVLNLSLRECCFHCFCKAGVSHADITLGDFWGIERVYPELDDDRGTSAVMLFTSKAEKLWESIAHGMIFRKCEQELVIRNNECYSKSSRATHGRRKFVQNYRVEEMELLVTKCLKITTFRRILHSLQFRFSHLFFK